MWGEKEHAVDNLFRDRFVQNFELRLSRCSPSIPLGIVCELTEKFARWSRVLLLERSLACRQSMIPVSEGGEQIPPQRTVMGSTMHQGGRTIIDEEERKRRTSKSTTTMTALDVSQADADLQHDPTNNIMLTGSSLVPSCPLLHSLDACIFHARLLANDDERRRNRMSVLNHRPTIPFYAIIRGVALIVTSRGGWGGESSSRPPRSELHRPHPAMRGSQMLKMSEAKFPTGAVLTIVCCPSSGTDELSKEDGTALAGAAVVGRELYLCPGSLVRWRGTEVP